VNTVSKTVRQVGATVDFYEVDAEPLPEPIKEFRIDILSYFPI